MMSAVLTILIALAVGAPQLNPRCTIVRPGDVYVREPDETWIIGSVLADTVVQEPGEVPAPNADRRDAGQAVVVESVLGAGSGTVIQPGDTVAIFLWSLGPSCNRSARPGLPVGSRHHFELTLRPDSIWAGAMPTLDNDPAGGLGVFPARSTPPPISVDEYAAFVSLIPTREEWNADCRPGVQRTNAWISAHVYGRPPGIRPFGHVAVGLVGACESDITEKGNALLRVGESSLPAEVRRWAEAEHCTIGSGWSDPNLHAIPGRFLPEPRNGQWAIICSRDGEWRLLVVQPREGRVLAELARLVGSPAQRTMQVAPPEFFRWATLTDPSNIHGVLAVPSLDAVLLDEHAFFWDAGRWSAAWYECCYFEY